MEIVETRWLVNNLDGNSRKRLTEATVRIKDALNYSENFLKANFYSDKVNWWEHVVKEWDENVYCPKQFIAFMLLRDSIISDGVKKPIRADKKPMGSIFLQNGCHRLSIAKMENIKTVPLNLREEPQKC